MGQIRGIQDVKISSALDYASGTAARTGAILDMNGYTGVLMIVKFAAITGSAVSCIKAQSGAESNLSDAADLEGCAVEVADNDDNQLFVLDIYEPNERYVRVAVDKDASHATAESAIYVQYGARNRPVENTVADALTYERHMSPAEGVS
jgi:hypothetical protein